MIKKNFLFPECYVHKTVCCDNCGVELQSNTTLLSNPPQYVYVCPNCNKEYVYGEDEIRGEWKWRMI